MKVVVKYFLLMFIIMLCIACFDIPVQNSGSKTIGHGAFTKILKEVVCENGVDYGKLIQNDSAFNAYLKFLRAHHPDEEAWTVDDKKAYWINAYNAFTLKLVIDNYPMKSIKDLNGLISIPFVSTIWDKKWIDIQGFIYSLNDIEHGILRKHFDEPRIHFALNCGAVSCPALRNEAYEAKDLDTQLNDQARLFLSDISKNEIGTNDISISKIFLWFKSDFTKRGTLIEFLNIFVSDTISSEAEIKYQDYDWQLNAADCQ